MCVRKDALYLISTNTFVSEQPISIETDFAKSLLQISHRQLACGNITRSANRLCSSRLAAKSRAISVSFESNIIRQIPRFLLPICCPSMSAGSAELYADTMMRDCDRSDATFRQNLMPQSIGRGWHTALTFLFLR